MVYQTNKQWTPRYWYFLGNLLLAEEKTEALVSEEELVL